MTVADQAALTPMPLRKNRDFMVLWSGQTVAALGTSMAQIVYPLLALTVTGSVELAGAVGFIGLACGALLRLPAGVFVDRMPRKPMMVTCDFVRAATTASIAVAAITGHLSLVQLIIAAVINSACDVTFESAQAVVVRHVVPPEQLPNALAQNEARVHLASLGGQPLGGALYGLGIAVPVVAHSISFLISGTLIASIRQKLHDERSDRARQPVRADMVTGIRHVWASKFMRIALLCAAGFQLIFAALTFIVIASAKADHEPAYAIGLAFSMAGVGGIAGAWLATRMQRLLSPAKLVYLFGITASSVLFGLIASPNIFVIGPLLALTFFTATPANAMLATAQINMTPPELQGRVLSATLLVAGLAAPLGPLFGGWMFENFGRATTYLVLAILAAVITVRMLFSSAIKTMRLVGAE